MAIPYFVYQLMVLHFLAVMNSAAVGIHIQVSVWAYVFFSLGHTFKSIYAWSRILRPHGNSAFNLSLNYLTFSSG